MASLKTQAVATLKGIRRSPRVNQAAIGLLKRATGGRANCPEALTRLFAPVGWVDVPLPNGRSISLWTEADDQVARYLFWGGWRGFQPQSTALFYLFAEEARVTLDVGAYAGYHALLAAQANPDGRVIAFEPHPSVFERLTRNVTATGAQNVLLFREAAGATDGTASLFISPDSMPSSSSLSKGFMENLDGLSGDLGYTSTPVVALDGFLAEHDAEPDLIKIDTEATEPDVLRGCRGALERLRPHIFCEVLPGQGTGEALQEILAPLDYRFYALTVDGPRASDSIDADPRWEDHLFTTLGEDEIARLWGRAQELPALRARRLRPATAP